jgi:hypothetical protein
MKVAAVRKKSYLFKKSVVYLRSFLTINYSNEIPFFLCGANYRFVLLKLSTATAAFSYYERKGRKASRGLLGSEREYKWGGFARI